MLKQQLASSFALSLIVVAVLGAALTASPVQAAPRVYLDPSDNIYTTNTASVGTKFNVTAWVENAVSIGGAQVYVEFNDTIISATRWFEPKDDPQYIFYGKSTSALPTPPDPGYTHLGAKRGRVLISTSLFPPNPPFFTGTGKICIFEFEIIATPTESGKYTSALIINTVDTYLLDGDTGNEIPGVIKDNGYYEISKEAAKFTLTITSTKGGTTDPVAGAYEYAEGTEVTVTAYNSSGFVFDHWELDSVNIGADLSVKVTMDKNHALHAVFKAFGMEGDANHDGKVDLKDVYIVEKAFGTCEGRDRWNEEGDLNLDGVVDLRDYFIVRRDYGRFKPEVPP